MRRQAAREQQDMTLRAAKIRLEVDLDYAHRNRPDLMTTADCRFTICLPSYNGGDYLKACVESVLAQTYPNFELVVLDDASTDGSLDWLAGVGDRRVRVCPAWRRRSRRSRRRIGRGKSITAEMCGAARRRTRSPRFASFTPFTPPRG